MISSNASRILCDMGLRNPLDEVSIHMKRVIFMKHDDGMILTEQHYNDDVEEKLGAPLWQIHRADLHDVLLAKARELSIEITMGAKVKCFDWDAPSALLEDGTVVKAHVILVADGMLTCLRQTIIECLRDLQDIVLVPEQRCLVGTRSHGLVGTPHTEHSSIVLNSRTTPC